MVSKRHELQARVFQALGHPLRVAIAEELRDGEVCVCDLAERVGSERSNVSRHLAVMLQAGVLSSRKEGLQVFYTLRTPCILDFLCCATRVVTQSVEEHARALTS